MTSSRETCLLCLQTNANTINFYSETGKELNIISILSTHFWFQLDEIKVLSQNICGECWKKTESFHDFYQSIQLAHKKFETVFVKIENDLDIEVDEEIYLPSEEVRQPHAVEEIYQPEQVPHANSINSFVKIESNRDSEDDESSDTSVCEVPYTNSIDTRAFDLLPKRTKDSYLKSYNRLLSWKAAENIDEDCFSEAVMLEYFHYLKSKYKPSTLSLQYSMLRTTIQNHNNVDINYPEVTSMVKNSWAGFQPHKSNVFQPDEIQRFFSEANDYQYLAIKIIMIFLVYGARGDALTKVEVNDVNKQGSVFIIKIREKRTNDIRSFTVENEYAACVQKYKNLRPANVPHDRFFINYQRGKCRLQPIGRNNFMNAPKVIAKFLKLENTEGYTCYSFRSESSNNVEKTTEKTEAMSTNTSSNEASTVANKGAKIIELDSKYLRSYDKFMEWKTNKNIDKECFSKEVMLQYFNYRKNNNKPTTLLTEYSMLRTTIQRNHNIDIEYPDVRQFLKTRSFGYLPQKASVFLPEEMRRFLYDAEDEEFLAVKVIMIFGFYGATRTHDLTKVEVKDVTEQGSVFTIKMPDGKKKYIRSFTVENEYAPYVKRYKELRPENTPNSRFFIKYKKGKCSLHPMGRNKFLDAPKVIANYLNLKDANSYTCFSFRTNLLKRKRGSRSATGCDSYIKECLPSKKTIVDLNSEQINLETSAESDTANRLCEDVKDPVWDFLPEKSREKYVRSYENFLVWKAKENIDKECFSEAIMLEYFNHLKIKYNPNSLWQEYSVLRTTVQKRDNVDISYPELKSFLKKNAIGFQQKKAEFLHRDEIVRFLSEAEDIKYLAVKVIIIFAFHGAARPEELTKIEVKDVVDQGSELIVQIVDSKTNAIRLLTIEDEYASYVRKYKNLRPKKVPHRRFFINYQHGKCTVQPIGINTFRIAPKAIAKFLNLEAADNYLLHSLKREPTCCRQSKKLLTDFSADKLATDYNGGSSSSNGADNHIEEFEHIRFKRSTEAMVTSTITSSTDRSNVANIQSTFQAYHAASRQIQTYQLLPYSGSDASTRESDAYIPSDERMLWGMQFNNFHNL